MARTATLSREMAHLDVLVVDDEERLAVALAFALDNQGFRFRQASSSAQMWLELERSLPDAVLMDIQLVGESGVAICAELRRHPLAGSLPVVIVSGLADPRVHAMVITAGGDDFVAKPFSPIDLASRLRQAISARSGAGSPSR